MALQLSNYASALKEVILPYIRDNFPKSTILLDQLKRNAGVTFMNDEFIFPLRTSRHGGVANLADDGNTLISSSGATTSRGTAAVKILTGAFDISRLAIDATKTSKGAVENALTFQATSLASDFSRSVNRQLFSDGVGVLSKVRATGGSVSGTEVAMETSDANLDDGRSIDWYGTVNSDISPVKYFAPGQIVGIGTAGAADGTISAVTGTTIQLTGATASAANDAVFAEDGSGEGAGTMEIQGIRLALNSQTGTNTYFGVARNTTGWAPQFGSVSEALTLSKMESSYLGAKEYSQAGDQYAIFVNKTLYKKYGDILTSMRRNVNEADLLGGWTGLEFAAGAGRVGVFLDYDVPDGEVICLNMDTWTLAQVSDLDWLEDPNSGALLRLQNTITYQATMVWFANLICLAPAANGRETQKTG